MRVKNFLTERATAILYHYTSTQNALRILQAGVFKLSSAFATKSEEEMHPKGMPYFLSTTRSKMGDYHRYVGTAGVMFVLDGDWLNSRYKVSPVDYWERMWLRSPDRTREAEDRIFSDKPSMSLDCVTEIHAIIKEQDEWRSPATRQLLLLGKKRGIKTYLYSDEKAWRLQDKRRAISPRDAAALLKGIEPSRTTRPSYNYLESWLELMYKNDASHLSDRAEKLRYNLVYYFHEYRKEDQNLGVDLSNARKPDAADHGTAIKIVAYLQKNNMTTFDLALALHKKWVEISRKKNEKYDPMDKK
jgi:hypothetical protein